MNIDGLFECLTKLNINLSAKEICKIWSMDEASFSRKKKLGTEIKYKNIEQLEKALDIKLTKNCQTTDNNFKEVPIRGEVYASMGSGITVYNENQTGTYKISMELAKDLGVNLNNTEMIFASGDSMTPTIEGGDSLLIDRSKTDIYDGRIYCVRINGQLYAKRLQMIPPKTVKVISDNKEKYDPFYVDFANGFDYDFQVIGEIRWWGRVAR
jgi:phage repressor protein C with HTH and peptisase S24 domain